MLKTNSKIVRERIRAHIMNGENVEEYAPEGTPHGTFEEVATAIYNDFLRWYNAGYTAQRYRNIQAAFCDWAAGLPSIIDTSYYYNVSAVELLGDICEETPAERAKYSEEQAENYLSYLIYSEITKAARTA